MKLKHIFLLTIIFVFCFAFNILAMSENRDPYRPVPPTPKTENDQNYRWVWLSDEICARYEADDSTTKSSIRHQWDLGMISGWGGETSPDFEKCNIYSGKWSQSTDGIWSFTFKDCTIPVGVTKIDGVLYAFNGFGELQDGYEYYTGQKTGADGLVTADSAEFQAWLATQYVQDCTSN